MAYSATICMDNKEHASSVIKHMGLSKKYTDALISWTEKYLDVGNLERTIWVEAASSEDPYRSVQVAAEKDLEFTVLFASKKDRSSSDIYFLEGNMLLLFNVAMQRLKENSVSYTL